MRAPRTLISTTVALAATLLPVATVTTVTTVTTVAGAAAADASAVSGTVKDRAGLAVPGTVVRTFSGDPTVRRVATTDAEGRYTVGAEAGDVVVCFAPPEAADLDSECWQDARDAVHADDVVVLAGVTTTGIDPVLDPASHLRGRLTDAQGRPAAEVAISTSYRYPDDPDNLVEWPRSAGRTDDQGRFDVRLPSSGDYRLCFSDEAQSRYLDACWENGAFVRIDETVDDIAIELADRARVSGRVTSADHGSVAGTRVELVGTPYAATVGRDGRWSILGPLRGDYRLRVTPPPGRYRSQARPVEVTADGVDVTGLRTVLAVAPALRVARPTIAGRLAPGTTAVLRLGRWNGPVTDQSIRWYVGKGAVPDNDDRRRLYVRPWMLGQRITVVVRASTDRAERSAGRVSSRPSAPVSRR